MWKEGGVGIVEVGEKGREEKEETLVLLYLSITLYSVIGSPLSCGGVHDNLDSPALSEMFGALGTPATV